MVEISRDGKRVYFTNSLYGAVDPQFYPDGIPIVPQDELVELIRRFGEGNEVDDPSDYMEIAAMYSRGSDDDTIRIAQLGGERISMSHVQHRKGWYYSRRDHRSRHSHLPKRVLKKHKRVTIRGARVTEEFGFDCHCAFPRLVDVFAEPRVLR